MTATPFPGRIAEILLVEDNPADVELTRQGFADGKIANNLHVVSDGDEALAFLRREGEFADAVQPDLILLDLNLPGKDGRTVLEEIKQDEVLRLIPVVVLTTSSAHLDVRKSYQLHANAYMTKPVDFTQFVELVRSIGSYWFTLVRLPTDEEESAVDDG